MWDKSLTIVLKHVLSLENKQIFIYTFEVNNKGGIVPVVFLNTISEPSRFATL